MKKALTLLVILSLLGMLGWQVYKKATAGAAGGGRERRSVPLAVEISPVQKAAIKDIGLFSGSLYPRSEFTIAPKVSGRLEQILINIGDAVADGQLLAVLDAEEFRQQVIQAEAELNVVKATLMERRNTLENAKREYERTVALRDKKIVSESQLDATASEYKTQEAMLQVALAQVSQKEAALKTANLRLSYTRIRVPENSGGGYRVVGERFVDEGALLASNQPIVSILEIGKMIAVIHVIERDYPKIVPGLAAMITTDAFPGQTFNGNVVRIAPLIKEKSREARIEIEIPNGDYRLKPGMFVRVRIEFRQQDNATVIPVAALVKRNGAQGVFMADLDEKKARFVPITIGIVNEKQAEVLDPPINGQVITLGQHLLEDGGAIMVPEEGAPEGRPEKGGDNGKKGGKRKPPDGGES